MRRGPSAKADGVPAIAVVIVNYRTSDLTATCLAALAGERARVPLRAVLVDGGSNDGSADVLAQLASSNDYRQWVEFIGLPINGGFGYANNAGLAHLLNGESPPDHILLLNPDAIIEPGAVAILSDHLRSTPDAGAVGSQLLEPDGAKAGSAFAFPSLRGELARGARTGFIDRLMGRQTSLPIALHAREVDWVTGASVMLRSAALRESGLFDDGFFLYHEEIELMSRLRRAGWSVWHEPRSRVRHVGGAATGVHSRPVEGHSMPRRPAYWYQSRRRYFVLTRGRMAAAAAACMWLAGHFIWSFRRLFNLSPGQPVTSELADALRFGFPWRREAQSPSIDWRGPLRDAPAWMIEHG